MKRTIYLLLLIALATGMAAAAAVWFWPGSTNAPMPTDSVATVLPESRPLPEVTLTSHNGEQWTNKDLEGRWQFLFFGFTNCPDVCPTTLATLAGAMNRLQDVEIEPMPEVVFVSVDPQRDTPKLMKRYVGHFSDDFLGVTGDRGEIDRLTQSLGISYKLYQPDSNGDYGVDHSAAILLIDPRGELRALWQSPHDRRAMAEEFPQIRKRFPAT